MGNNRPEKPPASLFYQEQPAGGKPCTPGCEVGWERVTALQFNKKKKNKKRMHSANMDN